MKLNYEKFQKVIDDLESHGFKVDVIAYVNMAGRRWDFELEIEYTIKAQHPNGRTWEIIAIQEGD